MQATILVNVITRSFWGTVANGEPHTDPLMKLFPHIYGTESSHTYRCMKYDSCDKVPSRSPYGGLCCVRAEEVFRTCTQRINSTTFVQNSKWKLCASADLMNLRDLISNFCFFDSFNCPHICNHGNMTCEYYFLMITLL